MKTSHPFSIWNWTSLICAVEIATRFNAIAAIFSINLQSLPRVVNCVCVYCVNICICRCNWCDWNRVGKLWIQRNVDVNWHHVTCHRALIYLYWNSRVQFHRKWEHFNWKILLNWPGVQLCSHSSHTNFHGKTAVGCPNAGNLIELKPRNISNSLANLNMPPQKKKCFKLCFSLQCSLLSVHCSCKYHV